MTTEFATGKWTHSPLRPLLEETGGGGNCLFSAIARGVELLCGSHVSVDDVRGELARSINENNVDAFIAAVRADHAEFVPRGAVDLNALRLSNRAEVRVLQLRSIVQRRGTHFQGTDVCVRHLTQHSDFFRAGLGVIMICSHGPGFTRLEPAPEDPRERYLVLHCSANAHWKLAHMMMGAEHDCVLMHSELFHPKLGILGLL